MDKSNYKEIETIVKVKQHQGLSKAIAQELEQEDPEESYEIVKQNIAQKKGGKNEENDRETI